MVVTRAQEVSGGGPGGQYQEPEQPEASLSAPPVPFPVSPLSPAQGDRVDALAVQVHFLVAAVQHLQQQVAASQQGPQPPFSDAGVAPLSQQSTRGRASHREVPRRHISSGRCYREASKRPRSPSRHSDNSRRRRQGKEAERGHRYRHNPSPSLGSSREGSFDRCVARRAERRLEEYNQRLEELSHRVTNPSEADYDSRPPLSCRIMEEPISTHFPYPN